MSGGLPVGRRPNLPKNWLAVAMAMNGGEVKGCVEALRSACGNPNRSSVYRWANGIQEPSSGTRTLLNRLFVENGQKPPYPES